MLGLSDLLLRLIIMIVYFFILMIERAWDVQRGVQRKVRVRASRMIWEEPKRQKHHKTNGFH